jgi:hypothetical protein
MKNLAVDYGQFFAAFGRDLDREVPEQTTYLDLNTGWVVFVYNDDEGGVAEYGIQPDENRRMKALVRQDPGRYLEIPGMSHGEHHNILEEFLDSDWSADEHARNAAADAYARRRSFGDFKRRTSPETVQAFNAHRSDTMETEAVSFLRKHGVDVRWR